MARRWQLEQAQIVPEPRSEVFAFFADARNLLRRHDPLGRIAGSGCRDSTVEGRRKCGNELDLRRKAIGAIGHRDRWFGAELEVDERHRI